MLNFLLNWFSSCVQQDANNFLFVWKFKRFIWHSAALHSFIEFKELWATFDHFVRRIPTRIGFLTYQETQKILTFFVIQNYMKMRKIKIGVEY